MPMIAIDEILDHQEQLERRNNIFTVVLVLAVAVLIAVAWRRS